jgi:hypothetical protein
MPLTPAQRRTRARLAAYVQWSRTPDRAARTQRARDAFRKRFENQVDPDRRYPPEIRDQMVTAAIRAHMVAMARRPRPNRRKARS